jgi:WD40 repeat protein
VLTGSEDQTARLWPADGGGEAIVFREDRPGIVKSLLSPDGTHVATWTTHGQVIHIWPSSGKGEPTILQGHTAGLTAAAFSPDSRKILTMSLDYTARIWSIDESATPITLKHGGPVSGGAFSPDGTRVVTGAGDRLARIWSVDGTGSEIVLRGHTDSVLSASFSPDGKVVLTSSDDGTARLWPSDGRSQPVILRVPERVVIASAFSPDGSRVVTRVMTGRRVPDNVRVWRVRLSDVLALLRASTTACLPVQVRTSALGEDEQAAAAKIAACEEQRWHTRSQNH